MDTADPDNVNRPGRKQIGTGSRPAPDRDDEEKTTGRRDTLIRMLSEDDEATRWRAAESLGRLRDPAAVDALIGTLWDEDPRVRIKAAWALGEIGDMRAVPALRRLYRMEREDMQEIIRDALDAISRIAGTG